MHFCETLLESLTPRGLKNLVQVNVSETTPYIMSSTLILGEGRGCLPPPENP